jgi:hypothetical protein
MYNSIYLFIYLINFIVRAELPSYVTDHGSWANSVGLWRPLVARTVPSSPIILFLFFAPIRLSTQGL